MRVLHGMPHVFENSYSRVALSVRAVGGNYVDQASEIEFVDVPPSEYRAWCRCDSDTRRFSGTSEFDSNTALQVPGESNTLIGNTLVSCSRFATDARPIHAALTTPRLR